MNPNVNLNVNLPIGRLMEKAPKRRKVPKGATKAQAAPQAQAAPKVMPSQGSKKAVEKAVAQSLLRLEKGPSKAAPTKPTEAPVLASATVNRSDGTTTGLRIQPKDNSCLTGLYVENGDEVEVVAYTFSDSSVEFAQVKIPNIITLHCLSC